MKILIDAAAAYFYRNTGIGAYGTELLAALNEMDHGFRIDVFTGEDVLPLRAAVTLPGKTDRRFWERAAETRGDIGGYDLCHNIQNGIGLRRTGARLIVTLHDMIPLVMPEFCGSPYRELFRAQSVPAAETADAVITVSRQSKRDILRFSAVREENIHVIYEGPKRRCQKGAKEEAAAFLRRRYGITEPFLLCTGGFNERKNAAGIVRACAAVRRRLPTCSLVFTGGDSPRRRRVVSLAKRLFVDDMLRFPGDVPGEELPFFYRCCAALVYPSFYEGFGLPPLEAAACGAPSVLSRRGALPEIMGAAAVYADPNDAADIGEAMLRLVADRQFREETAERAFRRSAAFSFADTAAKTAALYENICRRRSVSAPWSIK
ncbi:MAG: glycosyltransferase family 4 protein [Bacillota bacterium]|jgi:glycosyltransferase involved in cell wall biosynthesis